jgi:hypothetical protein
MNVPLFTLLVFLTVAYFADEILGFLPEEVKVKYYQLWMDIQREKGVNTYTFLPLETAHSSSARSMRHDTQRKLERQVVQSELVFGLSVIRESV